jgi:hypothetical protein
MAKIKTKIKALVPLTAKVYQKASEMMLWEYIAFLDTSDPFYFSDFHKNKRIVRPFKSELEKGMDAIFSEITDATQNTAIIQSYEIKHKILKLTCRIQVAQSVLNIFDTYGNLLTQQQMFELCDDLDAIEFYIDRQGDIIEQLQKVDSSLPALITEIQVLNDKLENLNKSEKYDVEKDIIEVANYLELRYPIDPQQTTLKQWLVYVEKAREKANFVEQENMKHGRAN